MEYIVGIALALVVALLIGRVAGFDRDRVFYPFIAIASASYYQLFAIIAADVHALTLETGMFMVFLALSVLGFRTNLWLVVTALTGHGDFDLFHADRIANPGVPTWWPMFRLSFDLVAAGYLAWLLRRSSQSLTHPVNDKQAGCAPPVLSRLDHPIRSHVQTELDAAARAEKSADAAAGFHALERAHVLSQVSTREHVRVHCRMLVWGIRRHDTKEIAGQLLRIIGAATKTPIGLVPSGNTGGTNVSRFKSMPIPDDIVAILAQAAKD